MSHLEEEKNELGPRTPKETIIPLHTSNSSRNKSRKIVRFLVLVTSTLCLWLWVLSVRQKDDVPTRFPLEDSYIHWPMIENEVSTPKIGHPNPEHEHTHHRILNGKPAERIFLQVPNNESAIETSRRFTAKPHMAGTPGDYDTAIDFLHTLQTELGIESTSERDPVYKAGSPESREATLGIVKRNTPSAWVDIYYPVLNTPLDRSIEILGDNGETVWTAQIEEIADNEELDPDAAKYAESIPTFHGLSRGGTVQGKLVYANYGRKEDYDALEESGVNFTDTIVITRYGGIFRGLKVKGAQERGAIGCLIYSDPRDDGTVRWDNGYAAYPLGPARNPTSVQRGSVQFLSLYPGDPTTPGYPSYENSTRTEGESIPKIPSLPISWNTASRLLQEIETDGKNRTIKLVNNVDIKVTPIWNTMAVIPGHIKNEIVIAGNHRDAWVLGATDPSSGTVSILEVIRGLGVLLKKGWRPLRTIVLASWDAEEYGLIGSTEWGEDFADFIDANVVGYLNLDSSVSGSRFSLAASPSLAHLVRNAAQDIPHPTVPGRTLWQARLDSGPLHGLLDEEALQVWQEQWGEPLLEPEDLVHDDSLRAAIKGGEKVDVNGVPVRSATTGVRALGSGSDYTVFLQRIGVASANGGFGSTLSDPVYHYHSVYDSESWQERFGDPGFHRHVAIAKHLGLTLLRLVDSIVLPLNTTQYAYDLDLYLNKVEDIADEKGLTADFSSLRSSISKLQKASTALDKEKEIAEKHLRRLLYKWWKHTHKHGHGHSHSWHRKAQKVLKKVASWFGIDVCQKHAEKERKGEAEEHKGPRNLGLSKRMTPRIGRYPAWLKEQKEKEKVDASSDEPESFEEFLQVSAKRPRFVKKFIKAAKRVQRANKKLVAFERGFIHEDGIKDREWYRHLGVAPGKWLGYGATTFPALTEAFTFEKNATLAKLEAKKLENLIDDLTRKLKE